MRTTLNIPSAWVVVFALGAMLVTGVALAVDYKLRIQTHFPSASTPGRIAAQFIDDVQIMSGGRLQIQMHWSSEVVSQRETFGAAAQGILDCDMTGPSVNVDKDPAFQFVGDIIGGYDTPYQFIGWLEYGGGRALVQELYDQYQMHFVGYWLQGHESLASTRPLAGIDDLMGWKFRSPPGLETEIFAAFGAEPVVMDFGKVANALRTGIVDGADASTLNTNYSLGLFDVADHATFPGFHSMPSKALACNKKAWNKLPPDIQRMIEVALKRAALELSILSEIKDKQIAGDITKQGVTLHDWSTSDRKAFRAFARGRWDEWKRKSPLAMKIVDSHIQHLTALGLID